MLIVRALLFVAVMLVAATGMGNLIRRDDEGRLMAVVYGFAIEWALAFAVGVPLVLLEKRLSLLAAVLMGLYLVLFLAGLIVTIMRARKGAGKPAGKPLSGSEIVYLGIFLSIVLFVLYKTVFYAYADGDDSFYVATARVAEASDRMYLLDAYIGTPAPIPYRYAFAPFPMWVASLARVSGIDSATLSHSVLAPMLIVLTYIIFNEISKLLFGEENREKRYMFLILAAVLELFSNVSTSTAGTFMLTRARQGKEALACIILPLLFYKLFKIAKEGGKVGFRDFITIFAITGAAALSSLLGNILVPIMLFGAVIWMFATGKGLKNAVATGLPVVISLITVLLYLKMR